MIEISRITLENQIFSILKECGVALHNQQCNNIEFLQRQARKFHENGIFLAASVNENVVGFLSYYRNDAVHKCAYISMFAVNPSGRCCGVGSLLMKAMEDDCRKSGFRMIRLEVALDNQRAHSFYSKRGFLIEYTRGGSVFMLKYLNHKEN